MTAPLTGGTAQLLDFEALWNEGLEWKDFVHEGMKQYTLWDGVYRHAAIPDWARDAFTALAPLRLLVLSADWCLDAANIVPLLARLAEAVPGLDLRQLDRDEYPDVMDRYLTDGTRSIPMVIGLDPAFHEIGHWGPRPSALHTWVVAHKGSIPPSERYKQLRRQYAMDRGESTLRELFAALGGHPSP